eukprot:2353878-Prymnesium_polylepis.1
MVNPIGVVDAADCGQRRRFVGTTASKPARALTTGWGDSWLQQVTQPTKYEPGAGSRCSNECSRGVPMLQE